ncbi:unnamed protein product (macronuclear) [Paramecium tetraurelia]|uniref:Auxin efflux carrier n=1 Tax=Paramecium tetraurelia TaxID=5888 RepID=A0DXJ7_PARTE|nr:uncharacterized protein GSPATT00021388001 [Paramecium tetraurelia]CAK87764.1 unnamed protein product [Paramecium tetraurelia]|eukprot:XP_001455161.1 hypothetical protein (macronuclear) [Paramecium tetraurelia strain d4-2]
MEILTIIIIVVSTTFGVFFISGCGAYLTHKKVITKQLTSQLSSLTEHLFIPTLIFTNFLKSLTLEILHQYIPCIIITLLCFIFGYLLGTLSNKYWIKEKTLNSVIVLATANPQTTNLQLQLCYGLSKWFAMMTNQPEKQIEATLITTVIIQTVIMTSIRWTIGRSLLQQQEMELEMTNLSEPQSHCLMIPLSSQLTFKSENDSQKKSFWNAPLTAAVVSIACICVPIVQTTILSNPLIYNIIFAPLQTISKVTSPIMLLILGSSLYEIYMGNSANFGKHQSILYIVFNRILLMPIIGMIMVIFILSQNIIDDKCQLFMLFLTFCTPSSINILLLAKQYQQSAEELVATVLLHSYLLAIITLPLWMIIYLIVFIA